MKINKENRYRLQKTEVQVHVSYGQTLNEAYNYIQQLNIMSETVHVLL